MNNPPPPPGGQPQWLMHPCPGLSCALVLLMTAHHVLLIEAERLKDGRELTALRPRTR